METKNSGIENFVANVGLTEFEGEPRARDLDIAERLGFAEPIDIRKLIRRHACELQGHGVLATMAKTSGREGGRPSTEYWINEEQALLISIFSGARNAAAVRTMLIKVFVAWRRGHLEGMAGFELDENTRSAIGGIVKSVVHKEIGTVLPKMVEAKFAETYGAFTPGVTAGEVVKMAGVADRRGLRGIARFVSDRMRLYSARNGAMVKLAELGMSRAFVFDIATAREWLLADGKAEIEKRVAERRGQGALHLVQPSKK